MAAEIRIGTSGWHYKHWKGPFYPPDLPASKMLDSYLQHFDTVEINNTFYRLPTDTALAAWRDSTPANFRFAVKGSRYLTHMKSWPIPKAVSRNFSPAQRSWGQSSGRSFSSYRHFSTPNRNVWLPFWALFRPHCAAPLNSATQGGTARKSTSCCAGITQLSVFLISMGFSHPWK